MSQRLLKFFQFAHLPKELQPFSAPFWDVACSMQATLPDGPEKEMCMRKLLEAKDCAVRAALPG
jgi:ferritin-like protein